MTIQRAISGYTEETTENPIEKILLSEPHTDLGNVNRLLARYGDTLAYCKTWKKWLVWNGKYWEVGETLVSGKLWR
jgi:D5 N terminal like